MKYCSNCHSYHNDSENFCPTCGCQLTPVMQTPPPPPGSARYDYGDNAFSASGPEGKSRGVAALLAILLGGLGVHYFYLGKVGAGLLTILLTIVTCSLWDIIILIQGILMFCMTNEEFERKYVQNPALFPIF